MPYQKRQLLTIGSWCLYDYANTIFAFAVMGFYFPQWIILELKIPEIFLGLAYGLAMLAVGASTPAVGVISDLRRQRVPYVAFFTLMCLLCTCCIGITSLLLPGVLTKAVVGLCLFAVATYCYASALSFYNALMPEIATPATMGKISGAGVALGYLGALFGGAIVFIFVDGDAYWFLPDILHRLMRPFVAEPFHPGVPHELRYLNAFIPTALYFFVFAIPFFLFVKDRNPIQHASRLKRQDLKNAYRTVFKTLKATQKYPGVLRYLIAKSFYEDALETTILFLPLYAEYAIGIKDHRIKLILVATTSVFASLGSFLSGMDVDRRGAKRTLMAVVAGWAIFLLATAFHPSEPVFWACCCILGSLLGAAWTSSRPLLTELTPPAMASEFFGLYSLSGKVATVIGPILFTGTVAVTRLFTDDPGLPYRLGAAALGFMVLVGFTILIKVPDYSKTGHPPWEEETSPASPPDAPLSA